jgi:hypothetical protein
VSDLSDEEIYREVGQIVSQFDILECYDCATAVMRWLAENGIEGKVIKLRTRKRKEFFIISDRLERQGITESITDNGQHYGVEVRGLVFDNLSSEGMTREDWLNDFHCHSEQFIVEDL